MHAAFGLRRLFFLFPFHLVGQPSSCLLCWSGVVHRGNHGLNTTSTEPGDGASMLSSCKSDWERGHMYRNLEGAG
eukprot:1063066-Pelagomonas_calceolata.AAC.17